MATVKRATLIGATGLIGSHLLSLLQDDDSFSTIRLLVRRPFQNHHPKTEVKLIDFEDAESFKLGIEQSEVVFCTIGTTQQKTNGDKEAYRKVDYDIAVKAAKYCKETGCENFVLVSSVGANAQSKNFYLRLKGEIEEAVSAIGLSSVSFFRPSMLLGNRKEKRSIEKIGQKAMQLFSIALPAKYRPIPAQEVAAAMVWAAKNQWGGLHIYEYKEIKSASKK